MVAAHNIPGTPEWWKEMPVDSAALLVEFGAADDAGLDAHEGRAAELLAGHQLLRPPEFSRDPERIELNWRVREGLHGLVGRLRPPGTALIVEDVCVRPERMADAAREIRALLGEHGFLTGVAGHASAGNLHFMLTPDFGKREDVERYEAFMERLVELVLDRYDGSLKAEHGTGINMAPYVEREWGEKATELMWRVKRLADPDGVLGPGVVLNPDPGAHLRDLKTTPPIEEAATTCVECGFCEPVCPSRNLTTTPRQRIVLRREMARQPTGSPVLGALLSEYEYDGLDTCAADGTCKLECPLSIDTGALVKELRARRHSSRAERAALGAGRRWRRVEAASRAALRLRWPLARFAGGPLPPPAPSLPRTSREGAAAVYLPACINRIFGRAGKAAPSLPAALVEVSRRAGMPLWIPEDVSGSCCGVPWSSKGFRDGHAHKANEVVESLWRWSGNGALPVVVDASSCAHGIADPGDVLTAENAERHAEIEVLDSVAWARNHLLPRLEVRRRVASVAVHPTCSVRHLGLAPALAGLAEALAEDVHVPPTATCCGFAGDRGFLHPELTAGATAEEAAELAGRRFDAHLCSNRTCEIGLERGTGRRYESFAFLLEELTRS
jgi:D-lactate dehydrogenase